MDIFSQLKQALTTYHPMLPLGNESLKEIQHSDSGIKPEPAKIDKTFLETPPIEKPKKPKKPSVKKKTVDNSDFKPAPEVELPKKRSKEYVCPFCEWIFPSSYQEEDMNRHAEMCIDGKGHEDISNHRIEEKKAKKKKKVKKPKKKKTDLTCELLMQYQGEEIEEEVFEICPHCELYLGGLDNEFKCKHLLQCKSEQTKLIRRLNRM